MCRVYMFLDLELPSDYYKRLVYDLHEENKALKRMNKLSGVMEDSSKRLPNYSNNQMVKDLKDDLTFVKSKLKVYDRLFSVVFVCVVFLNLIILSSDSSTDEDMNEGPSVARVPIEGPSVASVPKEGLSITRRPYVGPELAKVFKAGPPPALLEGYLFDNTNNDTTDNIIKDDYASDVSYYPKSKSEGKCLPVGKKASHKVIKNKNAEDTSDLSYTLKSNYEEKYVPVGKKTNQK
ncbi:hypothetical protein Tco_0518101 [Tanacetum coccineum]